MRGLCLEIFFCTGYISSFVVSLHNILIVGTARFYSSFQATFATGIIGKIKVSKVWLYLARDNPVHGRGIEPLFLQN